MSIRVSAKYTLTHSVVKKSNRVDFLKYMGVDFIVSIGVYVGFERFWENGLESITTDGIIDNVNQLYHSCIVENEQEETS